MVWTTSGNIWSGVDIARARKRWQADPQLWHRVLKPASLSINITATGLSHSKMKWWAIYTNLPVNVICIYIYIYIYIYIHIYIIYIYIYIYIYILFIGKANYCNYCNSSNTCIRFDTKKKFRKRVSLLFRKRVSILLLTIIICSNSQSIQVYSLNLYYMNKIQSL